MRSKLWPIHNRPCIDMMHVSCETKVVADQDIDHLPNALSLIVFCLSFSLHTQRGPEVQRSSVQLGRGSLDRISSRVRCSFFACGICLRGWLLCRDIAKTIFGVKTDVPSHSCHT